MDTKTYKAVRPGAVVRTIRELRTGMQRIPADTQLTVVYKRGGFDCETEACDHCGVSVFIRRVGQWDVELVRHAQDPTTNRSKP